MSDMKHKYIVTHKNGGHQVMVWLNGRHHYIGLYKTIEEAIIERDKFIKKYNVVPKYNNIYFDNKEAYKEMIISQAQGRLTPKLMFQLLKIVKGVCRKFRYKEEDDRLDCEAYSVEMIMKNWYHFDENKYDNVLAYFTEIVKRAFAFQFKQLQKTRINTISLDYTNEDGDRIINI